MPDEMRDLSAPAGRDGAAPAPLAPAPVADDLDFQEAVQLFREPQVGGNKSALLLISLVAFVASSFRGGTETWVDIAVIVAVLTFHELGHFVGMRGFGYHDVKVFFVPFFGAAASGKRRGAESWKEGLVLLLGPLPGLVLGVILVLTHLRADGLARTVGASLVFINGFNLLPFEPLDGGRLFHVLLFSRSRKAETAFTALSSIAAIAGAVFLEFWVLGIFGLLGLVTLPMRRARAEAAAHLAPLPPVATDLDAARSRALYDAAAKWVPPNATSKPKLAATVMEDIHQLASMSGAPGILASLALFGSWLFGVTLWLVGVVLLAVSSPEVGVTSEEPHMVLLDGLSGSGPERSAPAEEICRNRQGDDLCSIATELQSLLDSKQCAQASNLFVTLMKKATLQAASVTQAERYALRDFLEKEKSCSDSR